MSRWQLGSYYQKAAKLASTCTPCTRILLSTTWQISSSQCALKRKVASTWRLETRWGTGFHGVLSRLAWVGPMTESLPSWSRSGWQVSTSLLCLSLPFLNLRRFRRLKCRAQLQQVKSKSNALQNYLCDCNDSDEINHQTTLLIFIALK